jgi:hypothetical protein
LLNDELQEGQVQSRPHRQNQVVEELETTHIYEVDVLDLNLPIKKKHNIYMQQLTINADQ